MAGMTSRTSATSAGQRETRFTTVSTSARTRGEPFCRWCRGGSSRREGRPRLRPNSGRQECSRTQRRPGRGQRPSSRRWWSEMTMEARGSTDGTMPAVASEATFTRMGPASTIKSAAWPGRGRRRRRWMMVARGSVQSTCQCPARCRKRRRRASTSGSPSPARWQRGRRMSGRTAPTWSERRTPLPARRWGPTGCMQGYLWIGTPVPTLPAEGPRSAG